MSICDWLCCRPSSQAIQDAKKELENKQGNSGSNDSVASDNVPLDTALCSFRGTKLSAADFDILAVLGTGSFGKVFQVKHRGTGEVFAMKVLKKKRLVEQKQILNTLVERRLLGEMKHPFLVQLRFAFQTHHKLFLVMELFNGGELFYHLAQQRCFAEPVAKFYAAEIACALRHLHKHNVVYRDLKPENLIFGADGHVRLTDFGLSKQLLGENDFARTFCGTPEYIAPEVLAAKAYDSAVDWWSLGCLVFEMLTGQPPFYAEKRQAMYKLILKAPIPRVSSVSLECDDFLRSLLRRDPKKRLRDDAVFSHPWFRNIPWCDLEALKVEPPFRPVVSGPEDTVGYTLVERHIADEFRHMVPHDTPATPASVQQHFAGFTYTHNQDDETGRTLSVVGQEAEESSLEDEGEPGSLESESSSDNSTDAGSIAGAYIATTTPWEDPRESAFTFGSADLATDAGHRDDLDTTVTPTHTPARSIPGREPQPDLRDEPGH
ncbi:MAG: hypothetical protein MHM6MM_005769 [Cercozoa sp. M6MM]